MKQQIKRLSPHQNGKVFGVFGAVISAVSEVLTIPMFLMLSAKGMSPNIPSVWMLALTPVAHGVLSYAVVAAACAVYNVAFKRLGGIEFETGDPGDP